MTFDTKCLIMKFKKLLKIHFLLTKEIFNIYLQVKTIIFKK